MIDQSEIFYSFDSSFLPLCCYCFVLHFQFISKMTISDLLITCIRLTVFLDLHTLGIVSAPQPNGLAVPEASMHTVNKTSDVLNLMDIGLRNRARGSTAMNERSSRSHRFRITTLQSSSTYFEVWSTYLVFFVMSDLLYHTEISCNMCTVLSLFMFVGWILRVVHPCVVVFIWWTLLEVKESTALRWLAIDWKRRSI